MAATRTSKGKTGWIAGCAALLGVIACGWAVVGSGDEETVASGLPHALTVQGIKEAGANPGRTREALRRVMDDEALTDEQRRQARRNMRSVWREFMNERVDEYFTAAEEDKEATLDKHIDDLQKRMKERQQQREADERSEEERQKQRERMRELRQSRSQNERKVDSESRNPDDAARGMAYFSALRQRMEDRGLQMPGRFGGGSGGPGGSRGRGGGRGRR